MDLPLDIRYIDFHTHHPGDERDILRITSLKAGEVIPAVVRGRSYFSAGIHPWDLDEENIEPLKHVIDSMIRSRDILFAGEAGYDKMKGPAMELQREAFMFQAGLAEETRKHLVIHCVKGWDELLEAYGQARPSVRWIIHGYRGNLMLAESLVKRGFHFSLGMSGMREDLVRAIPPDRLMFESDDTGKSVREVYSRYSDITGRTEEDICRLILDNFMMLLKR